MKLAPIFNPSARRPGPEPVKVDLRKVFLTGTCLWVLALVECLPLVLWTDVLDERVIVVCLIGIGIGLVLLIWAYFHNRKERRLGD